MMVKKILKLRVIEGQMKGQNVILSPKDSNFDEEFFDEVVCVLSLYNFQTKIP